jgi:hypothetical protein
MKRSEKPGRGMGFFDLGRLAILASIATGAFLVGHGCGSVTNGDSRVQAEDTAAQHTCARYQACNQIGSGLAYADLATCTTQWTANWDSSWPVADCQGKIDQAELSFCLSAIDGTSCTSILDFIDTIDVKCAKATVCDGGNPPSTDGAAED